MPSDVEQQILETLRLTPASGRPTTFNDLARRFGTSAAQVSSVGRHMVEQGLAEPYYVAIGGRQTMFGLLPAATGTQPSA